MKKFFSSSIIWIFAVIGNLVVQFIGAMALVTSPKSMHVIVQYAIMALVQAVNVFIVLTVRKKRDFVSPYTFRRPDVTVAIKSTVLGIVTFVGMYLISQYVFEFLVNIGVKSAPLDISGWYIVPALITTVIFAPVGEEAVFRCSITYGLKNGKTAVAVIVSALAFTLMHMSPMQTVYQFVLGVMLAVLIIRSQNVVYPIIAHATSNLVVVLLSLVPLPAVPLYKPLTVVVTVLVFVLCVMIAFVILKSIKPKEESVDVKEDSVQDGTEKIFGIVAYVAGALICFAVWVTAFF
ncbi:MAG: CPBP family intramembrane metalloprotease [Clostridia bacterium]|nr:CPBP family intramembrane metalloprotease [Clostridia bacterium]